MWQVKIFCTLDDFKQLESDINDFIRANGASEFDLYYSTAASDGHAVYSCIIQYWVATSNMQSNG